MRQDREVREDEEYISTTQQHTVTTWQDGINMIWSWEVIRDG